MAISAEKFFDQVAPIYDNSWENEPRAQYDAALKWHVMQMALPLELNSDILEPGGGTGYWTVRLARLGYRVTMVDISRGMLSITEQKIRSERLDHLVQIRYGDMAEQDDLPSGHFALVLATGGSLNYCPNYRRAIQQMRRLCRPGGYICIDPTSRFAYLPDLLRRRNLEAAFELIEFGTLYEEFQGNRGRRHEFEFEELHALLEEAGLKVSQVLGNSILIGIVGDETTFKMLAEMGLERLIALEKRIGGNQALLSRALHFLVLCQVE